MPRIRLVTDSACDIPDALLKQYGITVLPLGVATASSHAVSYSDRAQPPSAPEALSMVEAPEVESFSRLYRVLREGCDGIISIHVSSKLSDTVANALAARETFGPGGQGGSFSVAVIDSKSFSMGLGWLVLAVARAASAGLDFAKLNTLATHMVEQSHVAFFTESLEGLLQTGRVPRLQAQSDSLSSMRPLLHLDDGNVVIYEKTRTRAKARDALYNFVEDFPHIGQIAIIHNGAFSDVEHLLTRVGAIYPRDQIMLIEPDPPVATWLGPDALGVAVLEGDE
ncbi:MAG: DegV family protein [Chloroflexota bacterium]|nr:DegV family protein [Chloroflexota bacterium]